MSGKAVLVGGAVVLAVVGGYWWMQQQKPIEANPEEVVLEEQVDTSDSLMEEYGVPQDEGQKNAGMVMYGESDNNEYIDSCPDMAGAVKLAFEDEHTEQTFATVKAYELENHANEFIEEGETHLIDYIDLNNDEREDFVTYYNAKNWCGSVGCLMEVFIQQEDGSYHGSKLLYGHKGDVQVTNSVMNGYRQIIAKGDAATPDGTNQLWTWDDNTNGYKRYGNCHKDAPTHDVVAPADMVDAPEEEAVEEE